MTKIQSHAYRQFVKIFSLRENEPLKNHTSFKVGGPADLFVRPGTLEELQRLIMAANSLEIPVTTIGGGTNLLVTDKGIRGLVINTSGLTGPIDTHLEKNGTVRLVSPAGNRLSTICRYALDNGLSGLEFAAGIPGTIGGAVRMNAGTPDGDMSGIVGHIKTIDRSNASVSTTDRSGLTAGYRHMKIPGKVMADIIIIEAGLLLEPGDPDVISNRHASFMKRRKATQPLSSPSAGCIFKNPDGQKSAGELIDQCGLKGHRAGQAMVSEKHANYIVNTGQATCEQIMTLMDIIKKKVWERYRIDLKAEVKIEGEL